MGEHTQLTMAGSPYRLLAPVGEGTTSQVWQAESSAGHPVALKIARDPARAAILADEAERLLFVGSPRVAPVLDVGRLPAALATQEGSIPAGSAYVALRWVPGSALEPRRFTTEDRARAVLHVARDVAAALQELHTAGSAHGDVKPANIIYDPELRRATLVDLGLGDDVETRLPRGGTRRYLPPELFRAGPGGDAGSRDVWALGITLAELASADAAASSEPRAALLRGAVSEPIHDLIEALLALEPTARPSAGWVERRARALLGAPISADEEREGRLGLVRRSYLALRRQEILAAARSERCTIELSGLPGEWVTGALRVARSVAQLRGALAEKRLALRDLDELGRVRWLVRLVGPSAVTWRVPFDTDEQLAARLVALAEHGPLEAITSSALVGSAPGPPARCGLVELCLALGAGSATGPELDAAERLVFASTHDDIHSLGVALGRTLRLRGDLGRALAVLRRLDTPEAWVEAAETARRARDVVLARDWLARLPQTLPVVVGARRDAISARLSLDAGDPRGALDRLQTVPDTAASLEVRGLAHMMLGDRGAAQRELDRSHGLARDDEERSRLAGVAAMLAHARGDMARAVVDFRQAAAHAARAGAILEEATYLTGVAAAASVVGEVGEALTAARRSTLLFEHLGRAREAARAMLTRAAAFAQIGAVNEACEAANDAIARARSTGDRVCQAYAHLALADVLPSSDRDGLQHAIRAQTLVEGGTDDDRLRVTTRLLRRGQEVVLEAWDRIASESEVALDARLEWWHARAEHELTRPSPGSAAIVTQLQSAATAAAPTAVRGPALAAGAELAAALGNGDAARRLASSAAQAARELLAGVPAELRGKLANLPWVASLQSPRESSLTPEQLTDVGTLVRALGRRDRLRPLLDQVLDALVLWTGVERGLLLLRAPGERFVPRAGRNLARSDLVGAQLELSHSLAQRAVEERAPVVAVDATGELPEVHASVHALKLRSVLAVPLVSRGEVLGVVYLDDRVRRGAFGSRELAWVRLVATLAAVAIADARDQLLLRRTARRARRAEQRLARELARREAALEVAERELARTRDARDTRFRYDDIVGQSESLRSMLRLVDRVTAADVPVLIIGESGSGKELVARAIHVNGSRATQAFVSENCGAIPEPLLESALFGHVRGAFTGANRPRAGLFEVAHRGTLFLDEIGEMSLAMQTKLLRVLESGEVRPVGSERDRRVDVRIIGATHRDLEQLVTLGKFREDLYYRLNVIAIRVPSLRERPGDIEILVRHFIGKHGGERSRRLTPRALEALQAFEWPGNVRQLENEVRRALVLADSVIDLEHLSPAVAGRAATGASLDHGLNLRRRVDVLEGDLVREALERTAGNQTRAAELLGLSRYGLQKMMKRLEIAPPGRTRAEES